MTILKLKSMQKSKFVHFSSKRKVLEYAFGVKNWDKIHKNGDIGVSTTDIVNELQGIASELIENNKKTKVFEFATIAKIYKIQDDEPSYFGMYFSKWEDKDRIYINNRFDSIETIVKSVRLLIREAREPDEFMFKAKVGTGNETNDCLFDAILKAHSFDKHKLPSIINSAKKFKTFFKYERNDKVDIFEVVSELEKILKCSFEIVGDRTYISKDLRHRNIKLKVKNQHVTLMCNKNKSYGYGMKLKPVSKDNIIPFCIIGGVYTIYMNDELLEVTECQYSEMKKRNDLLMIYCDDIDELKKQKQKYIKQADYFLSINKKINFYRSPYVQNIAFDIWRTLSSIETVPVELDDLEAVACDESNHGGIHYAKPGIYKNSTEYDMNKMYMYYMSHTSFTFPTEPAERKIITSQEINDAEFFQYGNYYAKVTGTSKFMAPSVLNTYQWHTHFALTIAKEENMTIEMYENKNSINSLLYPKNRANGKRNFDKYSEFAYKIREDVKNEKYIDTAKNFTSSLWGFFGSKKKKQLERKKDECIDLDTYNWDSFQEMKKAKNGGYKITYTPDGKIFKYPYARLATFLTSFCRLQLYRILKKYNLIKYVVHINTDGFTLSDGAVLPKKLIDSEEPGKFKIVKNNKTIHVINSTCKTQVI